MPATPHEADYRATVDTDLITHILPGTAIEIVREPPRRQPPRHVLFDFDGTLSLIREGWPEVMIPLMVEVLQATGTAESAAQLRALAMDFVMELNGKQTIYQMIRLAEEVTRRGGRPEDPQAYKQRYHDRLIERIAGRREALRCGKAAPETLLVPGATDLLEGLRQRGVRLYLASGTDEPFVREEATLLGLERYFGDNIHGAQPDYQSFSKAMVIARILSENQAAGEALLGFGDGYVEIQNVKEAGGVAVAVASDERARSGRPEPWKRRRLMGVGADLVIADYREHAALLRYLWNE